MKNLFLVTLISLAGSSIFAQSDIVGTWNTGDQNTLVKIEQVDGFYTGIIISSDNDKAKPGTLIMKDVKHKKDKLEGKMFAIRKGKWLDAELHHTEDKLVIIISAGFRNKTVEWTKDSDT
jgi:uncharacterized protein (DUF2147 family)